jgi:hypothetical protein
MDEPTLLLSYNSTDRPSVVALQKLLAARRITTFSEILAEQEFDDMSLTTAQSS